MARSALALLVAFATLSTGDSVARLSRVLHRQDPWNPSSWFAPKATTPAPKPDPCKCLNFKKVYELHASDCGRGFEFAWALAPDYKGDVRSFIRAGPTEIMPEAHENPHHNAEFCLNFFEKLDSDRCVKVAPTRSEKWYGQSWCYVSDQCKGAQGVPQSFVNVKICKEGKDQLMGDLSLAQLLNVSRTLDLDPGLLVKLAYQTEQDFVWLNKQQHSRTVSQIQNAAKPTVIDEKDARGNKVIVQGNKAYLLDPGNKQFKCIMGCDKGGH